MNEILYLKAPVIGRERIRKAKKEANKILHSLLLIEQSFLRFIGNGEYDSEEYNLQYKFHLDLWIKEAKKHEHSAIYYLNMHYFEHKFKCQETEYKHTNLNNKIRRVQ